MRKTLAALAVAALTLAGCSTGSTDEAVTVTTTAPATSTTNESSTTETRAEVEPAADESGEAMPDGTSEAGKAILMCGMGGLHEFGTTKFVDGTTGYTSTCDQHMRSNYRPVDTDVPPATEGIPDYGSDYQPPAYEPAPEYYEPPAVAPAPAPEVYAPAAPELPDGAGGGQAGY